MITDNSSDAFRVLWQRQSGSSFSMDPGEIQRRLSRLQAELRDAKILVYTVYPGMAIWFAYWLIFTTQPVITRAGLLLLVLGTSFWVAQMWLYHRDRQRALVNPDVTGQITCLEFYRAELTRRRNFNRGGWLWSRMLALYSGLLLCGWAPLDHHATFGARVTGIITISILAILSIWLSHRISQKQQQQIDSLDAMK